MLFHDIFGFESVDFVINRGLLQTRGQRVLGPEGSQQLFSRLFNSERLLLYRVLALVNAEGHLLETVVYEGVLGLAGRRYSHRNLATALTHLHFILIRQ